MVYVHSMALALLALTGQSTALSGGSPICVADASSMADGMGGTSSDALGFTVTASSTSYSSGTPITITVASSAGKDINGLLLYVADSGDTSRLGSFAIDSDDYKGNAANCGDYQMPGGDTAVVTHGSGSSKGSTASFKWTPSSCEAATVRAIVVSGDKTSWQIPADLALTCDGSDGGDSSSADTEPTPSVSSSYAVASSPDAYGNVPDAGDVDDTNDSGGYPVSEEGDDGNDNAGDEKGDTPYTLPGEDGNAGESTPSSTGGEEDDTDTAPSSSGGVEGDADNTTPDQSNGDTGYTTPDQSDGDTGYTTPDQGDTGYTTPDQGDTGYTTPDQGDTGYTTPDQGDTGYTTPDQGGADDTTPDQSNDDTDYSPELPVESEPSATGDVEGDTDNQSPDSAPSDYPSDDQQVGGECYGGQCGGCSSGSCDAHHHHHHHHHRCRRHRQHGGDRPTPVKVTYSTTTLPVEEPQAESTPAAVDGASDSQELGYGQPDNTGVDGASDSQELGYGQPDNTGVDGASDSQDPANETVESPPATPGGDNVSYGTTY